MLRIAKVLVILVGFAIVKAQAPMEAQANPVRQFEIPGAALSWIHLAEQEFARRKLDVSKYYVTVLDGKDDVWITLTQGHLGEVTSVAPLPEYEVQLRRNDTKIIASHFVK
jgi:hypothetical protein